MTTGENPAYPEQSFYEWISRAGVWWWDVMIIIRGLEGMWFGVRLKLL